MSSFAMFTSLTTLLIPSVVCNVFLLYYFLRSSQRRKLPRNFLIISLLIMNFIQAVIELPPRLYFLYTRTAIFQNPQFCNIWNWAQFTFSSVNLLLIALGSIERYLLIFHHIYLSQHVILLRYVPLITSILFPSIFYIIGIYVVQCNTIYNYNSIGCGLPCFFSISSAAVILKNIILICVPVIVTIAGSSLLLIRVFIQRRKLKRQRVFWRENIQMLVQILPIIILYLIIWLPLSILFFFSTFGTTSQKLIVLPLINDYFGNLKYLVNIIYPFLLFISQPELRQKIKTLLSCCPWNRPNVINVIPLTNTINNDHTVQN